MRGFLSKNYGRHGRWGAKCLLLLSVWAVFALVWPPRSDYIPGLIRSSLTAAVLVILLPGTWLPAERRRPLAWQIAVCALISADFFFHFYSDWIAQRKLLGLIARLGIWWPVILTAVGLVGIAFSLILQGVLLAWLRRLLEKIAQAVRAGEEKVGRVPMRLVKYLIVAAMIVLHFTILQYSMLAFPQINYGLARGYFALNMALLLTVDLALVLIVQRWRLAMLLSSVVIAFWAVGNHYVYLLHGSPLYIAELANIGAAAGVLGQYRIVPGEIPWAVLGMIVLNFVLLSALWTVDARGPVFEWKAIVARIALGALLIVPLRTRLVKDPPKIGGGVPSFYVTSYGFPCVAAIDEARALHPLIVPEGYDPALLPAVKSVPASTDARRPDIILILNESFCDLQYYADITLDRDILADFYSIENASFGHAAATVIGGGTNNSEYELLTGCPYYLLAAYAPFNYLDFEKIDANVVQYLERLGYATEGMHLFHRSIYNRNNAYPALGFDRVRLGPAEDVPQKYFGARTNLDESYYEVLKNEYNAFPDDDTPRFMYMLTMQNHGGYEQNGPEFDTVHIAENLGAATGSADEFLSCLDLSVKSFRELIDYFSTVDRPVVVCMVGDHAPMFIKDLPSSRFQSSDETAFAQRIVPYVLWSNCGYDFSGCAEYLNLFGLMPQLIRLTGLPVTPFYETVADMESDWPILLHTGLLMDKNGKFTGYKPGDERYEKITRYLYMSYNGLRHGDDYRAELFLPEITE